MTSRKNQIKGATATKRTKNWFQHFKNLLGNEATIDESKEIAPMFNDVDTTNIQLYQDLPKV